MPAPSSLASDLAAIVGERHVRSARAERMTYAMDGLPTHRRLPDVVVLPGTREELIAIVRLLAVHGLPFVPRGAGSSAIQERLRAATPAEPQQAPLPLGVPTQPPAQAPAAAPGAAPQKATTPAAQTPAPAAQTPAPPPKK